MSSDGEPNITGILLDDHTIIQNKEMQNQLETKGYGETRHGKFLLKPFETLYFLFYKKLELFKGKKKINFEQMLSIASEKDENALTKFLIYRDLRVRGYAIKDGFGFGSDFRVYDRGHFGEKGAKYLVFGLSEGKQERISTLQKTLKISQKWEKNQFLQLLKGEER